MSDDLLAQMARALADEHDGATAVPEATRARVIRTLAERRPRRSKWLIIGVPTFVLLGGGTAFAAASGKLPQIVETAIAVFTGEPEMEEQSTLGTPRVAKGGRSDAPQVVPPEMDAVEEDPEPSKEADVVEPAPEPRPNAATIVSNKPKFEGGTQPAVDPSLEVYRAAHEAHFKNGDCEGAVRGYRKYLREQPSGTFFLEAKYNLGVCLARLGRADEARAALAPFAEGKYGNYRKSQSQELLDALGGN